MVGKYLKKGNINIIALTVMAIIFILILFLIALEYVEVANVIMAVKNDLYYIAQNGMIANNKENFALNIYELNSLEIKQYIQMVLNKNYPAKEKGIVKIIIKECDFIEETNVAKNHTQNRYVEPIIHLKVEVKYISTVKLIKKEVSKIELHEDIKISLLQYK